MLEINDTENVIETDKPGEADVEGADMNQELDDHYNKYIENDKYKDFEFKDKLEDNNCEKSQPELIKSRNEDLEGKEHPLTGVPFERREAQIDGKNVEIVAPRFESSYDAQLPEELHEASDRQQFRECNNQLKSEIANNQELRSKFSPEELEQIENGDTPDGYTWHHDIDEGKMQLVDTEIHTKTGHTGGRSIWGGGTESR